MALATEPWNFVRSLAVTFANCEEIQDGIISGMSMMEWGGENEIVNIVTPGHKNEGEAMAMSPYKQELRSVRKVKCAACDFRIQMLPLIFSPQVQRCESCTTNKACG